jgi:hypothetical protein
VSDPFPRPDGPGVTAVTDLEDPRVISILSTEHWNLLSNRSLAYNEAFTRAGMFLTFLSMSFVALALLAQAIGFGHNFLAVVALVLAFDLVIGLATYGRIMGANLDDLRAVQGMARIRQAYMRIAPGIEPFLSSPVNDDIPALMTVYGEPPRSLLGVLPYALMTSGGMIGLILAMLAGVFVAVLVLMVGATSEVLVVLVGIIAAALTFIAIVVMTAGMVTRAQAALVTRFPAGPAAGIPESDD